MHIRALFPLCRPRTCTSQLMIVRTIRRKGAKYGFITSIWTSAACEAARSGIDFEHCTYEMDVQIALLEMLEAFDIGETMDNEGNPTSLNQSQINPAHQYPFYLGHQLRPHPPHQPTPAMTQPNPQPTLPFLDIPVLSLDADLLSWETRLLESILERGKCGQCSI